MQAKGTKKIYLINIIFVFQRFPVNMIGCYCKNIAKYFYFCIC